MKRAVVEERFEYKGFPCVVIMQAMCFRTGYVGLPKTHKFYEKSYDDLPNISCNGGLTYSENHLFGQNDIDLWWIGFDAGHCFNGYDVETAKKLFSDDEEAMKQISVMEASGMFTIAENPAMTLEDMRRDCIQIVEQILEISTATMNYIKAKYPNSNRSYTYRTEDSVSAGDIVVTDKGAKLAVVDEPVDVGWILTYGSENIAVVKKYEEPAAAGESEE